MLYLKVFYSSVSAVNSIQFICHLRHWFLCHLYKFDLGLFYVLYVFTYIFLYLLEYMECNLITFLMFLSTIFGSVSVKILLSYFCHIFLLLCMPEKCCEEMSEDLGEPLGDTWGSLCVSFAEFSS